MKRSRWCASLIVLVASGCVASHVDERVDWSVEWNLRDAVSGNPVLCDPGDTVTATVSVDEHVYGEHTFSCDEWSGALPDVPEDRAEIELVLRDAAGRWIAATSEAYSPALWGRSPSHMLLEVHAASPGALIVTWRLGSPSWACGAALGDRLEIRAGDTVVATLGGDEFAFLDGPAREASQRLWHPVYPVPDDTFLGVHGRLIDPVHVGSRLTLTYSYASSSGHDWTVTRERDLTNVSGRTALLEPLEFPCDR